jgi:dihydroxyacetone kinase
MELADALVGRLLDAILAEQTSAAGGRIVLLVNNLGGTPMMELAIVTRRAVAVLGNLGLVIERVYLGTFLSALEMAGVSLSVLPVDEQRLARLDASTEAPAWSGTTVRPRSQKPLLPEPLPVPATTPTRTRSHTWLGEAIEAAIQAGAKALIVEGPRLTKMDQMVGDGDLGISLERGVRAALQALPSFPVDDPVATLHALGVTLQRALGGTSGPLYAVFFLRAAGSLRREDPENPNTWAEAFQAGCSAIAELGGAARGDRTMLDALLPAAEAFQETVHSGRSMSDALRAAAAAASVGARLTADMLPRRGRSSYLGARAVGHVDPGAEAVAVWLSAVAHVGAAHGCS